MKRRITIGQLRLGMHIAAFEGSWFRHPFWRSSFRLTEPGDLATIRTSNVTAVVIDEKLGIPLVIAPAANTLQRSGADTAAAAPSDAVPGEGRARADAELLVSRGRYQGATDEIERAGEIVERSKRAVSEMFGEARLGRAMRAEDIEPLIDEIADSITRDASALVRVTRLKQKHEYTYLHSVAVCALMINLGRQMQLGEGLTRDLGMAGLLHDIGKVAVPDSVLDKPGSLDADEMRLMRTHPQAGHDLLLKTAELSPIALDVCLHHHERVDGAGYPFGLSGDQLSVHARMGAVCDVYDAVTSKRPYKDAWAPTDALSRMAEWTGHFDPMVFDAFIRSIGIYPVGTLVRLRSNRLGLVVRGNPRAPTRPKVCAFYTTADRAFVPLDTFTCSETQRGDSIVGLEAGDIWFGTRWPVVRSFVLDNRMPTPALLIAPEGAELAERRRQA